MKKFIFALIFILLFTANAFAEGSRFGVQFGSGGDGGVIYYGKDYSWAAGASIGFSEETTENELGEWDTDSIEYSIFARKNTKIADKTYLGLGVMSAWAEYDETVPVYTDGEEGQITMNNAEVSSWSISPYFILDYHVSENFVLNAGAEIVRFKFIDYGWGGDDEARETKKTSYMKPFFGLTYLF